MNFQLQEHTVTHVPGYREVFLHYFIERNAEMEFTEGILQQLVDVSYAEALQLSNTLAHPRDLIRMEMNIIGRTAQLARRRALDNFMDISSSYFRVAVAARGIYDEWKQMIQQSDKYEDTSFDARMFSFRFVEEFSMEITYRLIN